MKRFIFWAMWTGLFVLLFGVPMVFAGPLSPADSSGGGTSGGGTTVFDLAKWFAGLFASGGIVSVITGYIGKALKVDGIWMQVISMVVAGVLALVASFTNLIPVPINDLWKFLLTAVGGGLLTNLLHGVGWFDGILELLNAVTPHQIANQNGGQLQGKSQ